MRGMNSESVDTIYLDPPFNSNTNYAAPIGSEAAGAEFKDTWSLADIDIAWLDLLEAKHPTLYRVIMVSMTDSDKSYLIYMAVRILEMKRLLKESGNIYLHCDPTMSHYLKLVMDAIFGRKNFLNEIIWGYRTQGISMSRWPRKHDVLLYYAKDASKKHTFHPQMERQYYEKPFRHTQLDDEGRYYVDTYRRDVWDHDETKPVISQSPERTGYPTQKPLALLRRIIAASSNAGDFVFDPFCGCATALVAAQELGRQWLGIDISHKAVELVRYRLRELGELEQKLITPRTDILKRTDLGNLPNYRSAENRKYLYGEQGGFCNGCHVHCQPQHFEVDHIIAKIKGGTDHISNLQLLCGNCNRVKGDRGMEYLASQMQLRRSVRGKD